MAETVGALIVELRANSAQFHAEMDRARQGTRRTADEFGRAMPVVRRFASEGLASVIPAAQGAESAIGGLLTILLKAQGALLLLGKVGLVIGGILAVAAAVQTLRDKLTGADAEAKQLEKAHQLELKMIKVEAEFRRAQRKAAEERAKERQEHEDALIKQITKEREDQVKSWEDETRVLIDHLKARVEARKRFEAQLGQGAGAAGAAGGFAAVRRLREQIDKEARDLAFLQREGIVSGRDSVGEREGIRTRALAQAEELRKEFGLLPAVLDAIDRAVASVEFGNFGQEMEAARTFIARFIPTTDELMGALGQVGHQFATIPPTANSAGEAVRALTQDYHGLSFAVFDATQQLRQYNQVAAGG